MKGGHILYTKKQICKKNKKKAISSIDKTIDCLKDIPAVQCTEMANRKIDEALSYCFIAKDNL